MNQTFKLLKPKSFRDKDNNNLGLSLSLSQIEGDQDEGLESFTFSPFNSFSHHSGPVLSNNRFHNSTSDKKDKNKDNYNDQGKGKGEGPEEVGDSFDSLKILQFHIRNLTARIEASLSKSFEDKKAPEHPEPQPHQTPTGPDPSFPFKHSNFIIQPSSINQLSSLSTSSPLKGHKNVKMKSKPKQVGNPPNASERKSKSRPQSESQSESESEPEPVTPLSPSLLTWRLKDQLTHTPGGESFIDYNVHLDEKLLDQSQVKANSNLSLEKTTRSMQENKSKKSKQRQGHNASPSSSSSSSIMKQVPSGSFALSKPKTKYQVGETLLMNKSEYSILSQSPMGSNSIKLKGSQGSESPIHFSPLVEKTISNDHNHYNSFFTGHSSASPFQQFSRFQKNKKSKKSINKNIIINDSDSSYSSISSCEGENSFESKSEIDENGENKKFSRKKNRSFPPRIIHRRTLKSKHKFIDYHHINHNNSNIDRDINSDKDKVNQSNRNHKYNSNDLQALIKIEKLTKKKIKC